MKIKAFTFRQLQQNLKITQIPSQNSSRRIKIHYNKSNPTLTHFYCNDLVREYMKQRFTLETVDDTVSKIVIDGKEHLVNDFTMEQLAELIK
jgi:hypothetical protein